MKYEVNGSLYDVIITRKNNKNTYIKIKDDLTIQVTTNYFTSTNEINKLLNNNYSFLSKTITKKCKHLDKKDKFYLFGKNYDIIIDDKIKSIYLEGNKLYVTRDKVLNKWLEKQTRELYQEHIDNIYHQFEEKIPYPKLKIRNMKTRWGVCNKRDNSVTLNSRLIEFSLDKLDYVIVHELSHFVHFNHSKAFWETVSKYCKNYKQIRKDMKE